MDLAKTIGEIETLAKAGNIEMKKQVGDLTEQFRANSQRILDLEQKGSLGKGDAPRGNGVLNFGEVLAHDPKIEMLRRGETRQIHLTQKASLSTLIKSVLVQTGTSGTSPENGFPTPSEFISPAPNQSPGRTLQVLANIPHLTVSAGTAIVPEITSATDGSAVQEYQAGAKGQSQMAVHGASLPMATIATWISASKQLIDDVATLPTFLQSWLGYWVLRRLETLILGGSGSATDGHILGLVNAGTAYTSGQTKNADKIGDTIFTALPSYGYSADLVIVNSTDYFNIISERSTTGEYVGGGWGAAAPGSLWGVKTVSTPGLAAGRAIVMSTQLTRILDRAELQFAIGQPADSFTTNTYVYLSELRSQLMIGDARSVQVVALA